MFIESSADDTDAPTPNPISSTKHKKNIVKPGSYVVLLIP